MLLGRRHENSTYFLVRPYSLAASFTLIPCYFASAVNSRYNARMAKKRSSRAPQASEAQASSEQANTLTPAAAGDAASEVDTKEAGNVPAASNATPEREQDTGRNQTPASQIAQQEAGNASNDSPQAKQDSGTSGTAQNSQPASTHDTGNVPTLSPGSGSQSPADQVSHARASQNALVGRFMREGRWPEIARIRDEMMRACLIKHMPKVAAQAWTYSELDRLYPPLAKAQSFALLDESKTPKSSDGNGLEKTVEGRVQGLADIPHDWPDLPANASLAAEIGWVQAERLRIVSTQANGSTVVTLGKARSPAPSWSALSWLETSIRSYAKYVEVAAKTASTATDEQAQVRRERLAIEEIRELLGEMLVDE